MTIFHRPSATMTRANVVLVALSISCAGIPSLALAFAFRRFGWVGADMMRAVFQCLEVCLGLVLFFATRYSARRSYEFARRTGRVRRDASTSSGVGVDEDCPRAWLVHLHVELHRPSQLRADLTR